MYVLLFIAFSLSGDITTTTAEFTNYNHCYTAGSFLKDKTDSIGNYGFFICQDK